MQILQWWEECQFKILDFEDSFQGVGEDSYWSDNVFELLVGSRMLKGIGFVLFYLYFFESCVLIEFLVVEYFVLRGIIDLDRQVSGFSRFL